MNRQILELMQGDLKKVKAKGNFNTWIVLCPFHDTFKRPDHPTLFIDIKNQNYNCLDCQARGKLEDLERKLEKMELQSNQRAW